MRSKNHPDQADLFAWADSRPVPKQVPVTAPASWTIEVPERVIIPARKLFQRRTDIFVVQIAKGLFRSPRDAGQVIIFADRFAARNSVMSGKSGPRPDRRVNA